MDDISNGLQVGLIGLCKDTSSMKRNNKGAFNNYLFKCFFSDTNFSRTVIRRKTVRHRFSVLLKSVFKFKNTESVFLEKKCLVKFKKTLLKPKKPLRATLIVPFRSVSRHKNIFKCLYEKKRRLVIFLKAFFKA